MNKILYTIIFCITTIIPVQYCMGQERPAVLGGGGTNYSDKKADPQTGLRTGRASYRRHLIGLYGEGAYSQILHSATDIANNPLGYAYGGGLTYEYQHFSLRFHTGVGVRIQELKTEVKDFYILDNQVSDAMGYPYLLRYDFAERKDQTKYIHVQIPLMIGASLNDFYFLGGFKLNTTIYATNYMEAICSTSATYDSFLGVFEEMDNHGLRKDVPIKSSGNLLPATFDVLASIEAGYEFAPKFVKTVDLRAYQMQSRLFYRFRVSGFCDIGLKSMVPDKPHPIVDIPKDYKWDFSMFQMNHIVSSSRMTGVPLHNFYAGIKFTIFLDYIDGEECRLCGKYQTEYDMQ